MRILVVMVALAAILGRQSSPSKPTNTKENVPDEEVWQINLPEAIRIGLANPEPDLKIRIGAQEIPLGGFEPDPR